MNTPIYDFVNDYTEKNTIRMHMPGHKGMCGNDSISQVYPYDITEIHGADSLFDADGIILESEKNAAKLFGACRTIYSAGGSTLCIQTMLAMACKHGDTVVAARNSHRAFINACICLGLNIKWIYPDYTDGSLISGTITPQNVENILENSENVSCVYITSPDYLGKIADIKGIAEVCHKYGTKLAVDNAHGAHLAFLDKPCHPITLGADMCCDSAHKTLPVLTGGAYLHFADYEKSAKSKEYMSLFGSSSPSYLILQSLDLCNKYIAEYFHDDLRYTCKKVSELKAQLSPKYTICESEPLKLVIYTLSCGIKGYELAQMVRENGIEIEYADETHILFMFSTSSTNHDFNRVSEVMNCLNFTSKDHKCKTFNFPKLETVMSVRDAFFAESEEIPIDECTGRICAKTRTVCPPCVPVAVSGERFSEDCIKILKMYSILSVNVVK